MKTGATGYRDVASGCGRRSGNPLRCVVLLLWVVTTQPAHAHNGAAVDVARVDGITFDGDLSDWPDSLARHPIAWPGIYSPPSSPDDFQADFRVAYSPTERALYLAVEVRDDDPSARRPGGVPWEQDGCEVYLDPGHVLSTASDSAKAADQYCLYGDSLYTTDGTWRPDQARQGVSGVRVAVTRGPGGRTYEWRFDLATVGVDVASMEGGGTIGLDVSVGDADADGSFSWTSWGAQAWKVGDNRRLGDVQLAGGAAGVLTGSVRWPSGAPYTDPLHLRGVVDTTTLHSVTPAADGRLHARVVAGSYTVTPDVGSIAGQTPTVTVAADSLTYLDLTVQPRATRTVAAGPGSSRTLGAGTWRGAWHSLTTGDGLPGGVGTMLEDRHGVLWLAGTWPGVARLEGQSLTLLGPEDGLPDWPVNTLLEDGAGHLWLGMGGGNVVRYDGDSFTVLTLPEYVRTLRQDPSGPLWIAGGLFIARYDGETVQYLGGPEGYVGEIHISDMLVDPDGTVWTAGGDYGGVQRFDGRRFFRIDGTDAVPALRAGSLVRDAEGGLWVGTGGAVMGDGSGALRYAGGRVTTHLSVADGLADQTVRDLLVAADGSLWLATPDGASRYDGGQLATYRTADGLGHNEVLCLLEDRRQRLWFGTNAGLTVYDPHRLTLYTREDGLARDQVSFLRTDPSGGLWIGHPRGELSHFDGRSFTALPRPAPERRGVWGFAVDRGGTVWQGTNHGLVRYRDGGYAEQALPDDWGGRFVLSVAAAADGSVWWTRPMSLDHLAGDELRSYTSSDGLATEVSFGVLEDRDGVVWVGHRDGTVSRGVDGVFTTYQAGVPRLWRIAQDASGDLWFGGREGVARYDGETFHILPLAGEVWDIAQDGRGTMWFAAGIGGVARYDGTVLQHLTERDGIPGGYAQALAPGDDGDMWIGTAQGLVRYRPGDEPPTVALTGAVADRRYAPDAPVSLTSLTEVVAFEFESRSGTTSPESMVYLYRLAGHDQAWQQTATPRVEYRALPRGDYTFEVQAVDRDLNYSEPATLPLSVTLPYGTLSLAVALGVFVLAAAWQTTRLVQRDRRLLSANAQIEAASRNKSEYLRRMSHDLRSPMNAIIGYTRLVLRKARGSLDDRQVRNLENIEASSQNLLALINDILDLSRIEAGRLELHPQDTDLCQLVEQCADTLAPLVQGGVELVRQLQPVPMLRTDPERLRQVVMNLLGNAAKFTEAGRITLTLQPVVGGAEIGVADTGVGIPAADLGHIFDEFHQVQRQGGEQVQGTGLGLSIARRLVERLGGTIRAESEVGVGTTFTVTLPTG